MPEELDYSLDSTELWLRYTSLWRGVRSSSTCSFGRWKIHGSAERDEGTRPQQIRYRVTATCRTPGPAGASTWMLSSLSLARDQEGVCSECSIGYFCQQQTAAKSAHGSPGLVSTDCALEALCPRGGASGDYTYERSMA